jgi:hypothetical protein
MCHFRLLNIRQPGLPLWLSGHTTERRLRVVLIVKIGHAAFLKVLLSQPRR